MASQITDSKPSSSKKQTNILSGKKVSIHHVNIGNMILNTFKSKPDFIGQIDAVTGEETTFQQMREKSVKCALWLQRSFYSGTIITVCTCNQTLAYIPFLASLYIGAVIHPWDKKYLKDLIRVIYFLVEYEPEVIFIDSDDYDNLVESITILNTTTEIISPPNIITFDKLENVNSLESILNDEYFDENEIDQFSCEELEPTTIIASMFSSNATNYPGTVYTRYFALTCPSNQEVPAMSSGDIGLWYGSLTWNYSIILIVRCILFNVTVIKPAAFTDEDMYKTIEKYKVTWVFLDSSLCNQMFQTDLHTYDISSLKQFIYGDLPIRNRVCQSLLKYLTNVSIIQVYGISEACIIVSYERITPNKQTVLFCGELTKNVQIMITSLHDEEIKFLPPNEPGQIWYRFVCRWCKPEKCKSINCYNYQAKEDKLNMELYDIFSEWRCTEDYGYFDKDGKLFFLDKIRHAIQVFDKTLGCIVRVSSLIIENMLNDHPAVSEVVVVGEPHADGGQYPKVYIKKKDGAQVTAEELEEFVAKSMFDSHELHGDVVFLSEMPYLPNGKINRSQIRFYSCLYNTD